MVKQLVKLSKLLKNSIILPKYLSSNQLYCTGQISELKPKEKSSQTVLYSLLYEDKNPSSLLKNIMANKDSVEGGHIVAAITYMHQFFKENEVPKSTVYKSEGFMKLCSLLNREVSKMETPHLLQALKVLNLFEIPSSSLIVQSILQIFRNTLNNFTLDQIYFLNFLLREMKSTPLSNALIKALSEVFMAQLEIQLDRDDLTEMTNALRFASNKTDNKSIKYIVDSLINYKEEFDTESAFSILWSLCTIKNLPLTYTVLLHKVQEILMDNTSKLKEHQVLKILTNLLSRDMNGIHSFYNPLMIDKMINQMIIDKYEFNNVVNILNLMNKVKHVNLNLLDYLCDELYYNPSCLSQSHRLSFSVLVSGLGIAGAKPSIWDAGLKDLLLKEDPKVQGDPAALCYYTFNLASLDCFNTVLLNHMFSSIQIPRLMTKNYFETYKLLYHYVKVKSEYKGPWPSDEIIKAFREKRFIEIKDYPLLPALEKILGGPSFVKSNLRTELGLEIDHLILLQDEKPIQIDSRIPVDGLQSVTEIDDLIIPNDCKKIAVLMLSPNDFARNFPKILGFTLTKIKILEEMSFTVAPVSLESWSKMPDRERFPFLQTLLGLPLDKKFYY